VIDTGPGVPADARDRIFDRFYRSDGSKASGAGLGLSLARGAIEAIGGRLTLERSGSGGSTFRITLAKHPGSPLRDSGSASRNTSLGSREPDLEAGIRH
jgi:signal transduction histidine kinase